MKKNIEIKNKIINHLTLKGKKKTSEKIFIKSIKKLQKDSTKQIKVILKLALISSIPVFKVHKIANKKIKKKSRKIREIPAFISNKYARVSLSIKFILESTEKQKTKNFYNKLKQEILNNVKFKNSSNQKSLLQKQVVENKHYLRYYRWN